MARLFGLPKQTGRSVTANFKVLGIPEAVAKMEAADRLTKFQLGGMTYRAAASMAARARNNINSETGNLASGTDFHKAGVYSWVVTSSSMEGDNPDKNTKEYAGFVEFGTSKMQPRYFMTRAYQEVRPLVNAELLALKVALESL